MMNGARLHEHCERRLTTAQRILLYAAVCLAWDIFPGVGDWIRSILFSVFGDLMHMSNLMYLVFSTAISAVMLLILLVILHKVVFFCKEKTWPVIKPVLILGTARYVGLAFGNAALSVFGAAGYWQVMQLARELGAIAVALGAIVLPFLTWWVMLSLLKLEMADGLQRRRLQDAVLVLVTAVIAGLGEYFALMSGALNSTLIGLLIWAVDTIGLLLVLWKTIYPERMDTALPAKAAADGNARRIVSVDLEDIETRNEQQERAERRVRFGLDDDDDDRKKKKSGFSLFDRYDLDNNDERVIAQSSRDAIRVMEHNELEMKHEWNCDDDKEDHHK